MPDTIGALNAVATGYQPHSHLRCAATTSASAGVAICYHTLAPALRASRVAGAFVVT